MDLCASLEDVRREGDYGAADIAKNTNLLVDLRRASQRIIRSTGYRFVPYFAARRYDALGQHINDLEGLLYLREPLLVISSVQYAGSTDPLVLGTDYQGWEDEPPYRTLERLDVPSWSQITSNAPRGWKKAITITGLWGYRSQYLSDGWILSGDVVKNAPLTDSGTSITVNDADAVNALGIAPRFSPGQLLRVDAAGVMDLMEVTAVDTTLNTLTVRRGVNGCVAAAHAVDSPIYLWQVEEPINRAASKWAAFGVRREGAYDTANVDYGAGTTVTFPSDMPKEVRNILNEWADVTDWKAV